MITNLRPLVRRGYEKQQQDKNSLLHKCIKKLYQNIDKVTPPSGIISSEDQSNIVKQVLCLTNKKSYDSDYELLNTNTSEYMREPVTRGTTLLLVAMFLKVNNFLSEISVTPFWNLNTDNDLPNNVSPNQFWSWLDSLNLNINFAPCKNSMNRYINATQVKSLGLKPALFTLEGKSKHEWFQNIKTQAYNFSFAQDMYLENILSQQNNKEYFNASSSYDSNETLEQQTYYMACSVSNSNIKNQYDIAYSLINNNLKLNQESVKRFLVSMGFLDAFEVSWRTNEDFAEYLLSYIKSLDAKKLSLPSEPFLFCCLMHLFNKMKNNRQTDSIYIQDLLLNYLAINGMNYSERIEKDIINLIGLINQPEKLEKLFPFMLSRNKLDSKFTKYIFDFVCRQGDNDILTSFNSSISKNIEYLDESDSKILQEMQEKLLKLIDRSKFLSLNKVCYMAKRANIFKYFTTQLEINPQQEEAKEAIIKLMMHMKNMVGTDIEKRFVPAFVVSRIPKWAKNVCIDRWITSEIISKIAKINDQQTLSRITKHTNSIIDRLTRIYNNVEINPKNMVHVLDSFLYLYMFDRSKYLDSNTLSYQTDKATKDARSLAEEALNKFVTIEDSMISSFLSPIIKTITGSDKYAAFVWKFFKSLIHNDAIKNYFWPELFPSTLVTVIKNINDIGILRNIKDTANAIHDLYKNLSPDDIDAMRYFLLDLVFLMLDITGAADLNKLIPNVSDFKIDLSEFKQQISDSINTLGNNLSNFQISADIVSQQATVQKKLSGHLRNMAVGGIIEIIAQRLLNSISKPVKSCQDIRLLSRIKYSIDQINQLCLKMTKNGIEISDVYNLLASIKSLWAVKNVEASNINAADVKKYKECAKKWVKSIEKIGNELLSYNSYGRYDMINNIKIKTIAAGVTKYYVFPVQHLYDIVNKTNDVTTLKTIIESAEKLNKLKHRFYGHGEHFRDIMFHIITLIFDLTSIQI